MHSSHGSHACGEKSSSSCGACVRLVLPTCYSWLLHSATTLLVHAVKLFLQQQGASLPSHACCAFACIYIQTHALYTICMRWVQSCKVGVNRIGAFPRPIFAIVNDSVSAWCLQACLPALLFLLSSPITTAIMRRGAGHLAVRDREEAGHEPNLPASLSSA